MGTSIISSKPDFTSAVLFVITSLVTFGIISTRGTTVRDNVLLVRLSDGLVKLKTFRHLL